MKNEGKKAKKVVKNLQKKEKIAEQNNLSFSLKYVLISQIKFFQQCRVDLKICHSFIEFCLVYSNHTTDFIDIIVTAKRLFLTRVLLDRL